MNRGICQRAIFHGRADARYFLALLARAVRRGEIEVHAYCLMGNHFHLLVRSPNGRLAVAMRRIQSQYVRRFNFRTGRRGPLFEDRYRSKPVGTLAYRCILVRYLDDNPVKEGLVTAAHEYPYGSARHYARMTGPRWLNRSWIESEVRTLDGAEVYDPSRYPVRFPTRVPVTVREWVEIRIDSAGERDDIDDLIGASPAHVQEWLLQRARLADGADAAAPLASPALVLEELAAEMEDPWVIRRVRNGVARSGCLLAQAGILKDLCGLSQREISARLCSPRTTVQHRLLAHREALQNDETHARRCALVVKRVLARIEAEALRPFTL